MQPIPSRATLASTKGGIPDKVTELSCKIDTTLDQAAHQMIQDKREDAPAQEATRKAAKARRLNVELTDKKTFQDTVGAGAASSSGTVALDVAVIQQMCTAAATMALSRNQSQLALADGVVSEKVDKLDEKIGSVMEEAAENLIENQYEEVLDEAVNKFLKDPVNAADIEEKAIEYYIEDVGNDVATKAALRYMADNEELVQELAVQEILEEVPEHNLVKKALANEGRFLDALDSDDEEHILSLAKQIKRRRQE
eukprot:6005683-Karenia_brevis.AAC.1